MKVLATVHPGASVFGQMAPLLRALRDQGHDVSVATSRSFAPVVEHAGLRHVAAGIDWLESEVASAFPHVLDHLHDPHGALVDAMVDLFLRRASAAVHDDCRGIIAATEPDLVVHSFAEIGGARAADEAGVPHVMHVAGVGNWFARFCPVITELVGGTDWLLGSGVVVAEAEGWSARSFDGVDVTLVQPATPVARADGGPRPMVHVTLGTVFNTIARPLFKVLAGGASTVAARVVVTVGPGLDPARFTGLAPHVEVHEFLPLADLLAGCDAVLGHAGWGTVTACAAAGVPIGALVLGADHKVNAELVERAGFGIAIDPADCTPEAAATITSRLLDDVALRAAARAQAAAIAAMPTNEDAARRLAERFAR